MQLSAVLAFATVAFTLIAIPGPDWAFMLAAGARDHIVIPAVGGLLVGYAIITAVVVAGVAPLVAASPWSLLALTVAGSAYLIYLGIRVLRSPAHITEDSATERATASRSFRRGIGVSALHPKGLLLFLAALPQFASPAAPGPLPLQLALLGGVFITLCAMFYVPLGFAADRVLGTRPRVAQVTSRVAGGRDDHRGYRLAWRADGCSILRVSELTTSPGVGTTVMPGLNARYQGGHAFE